MNAYQIYCLVVPTSVGILYGYDAILMQFIFVLDAFRIQFGLGTWDGSTRNKDGTPITDVNQSETPYFRYIVETDNDSLLEGMISLSFVIGTLFGALITSYLGDAISRKKTLIASTGVVMFGSILCAFSRNVVILAVARCLTGIGIGGIYTICPVYMAETFDNRYLTSSWFHTLGCIGIWISCAVCIMAWNWEDKNPKDLHTNRLNAIDKPIANTPWQFLFGVEFLLSLICFILLYWIPHSPRWLCYKQRDDEAFTIISKLHSSYSNDDSEDQDQDPHRDLHQSRHQDQGQEEDRDEQIARKFNNIQDDANFNRAIGYAPLTEVFKNDMRRRTWSLCFLHLFQQWTGVGVMIYYAPLMFKWLTNMNFFYMMPPIILMSLFGISLSFNMSLFKKNNSLKQYLYSVAFFLFYSYFMFIIHWEFSKSPSFFLTQHSVFDTYDRYENASKDKIFYHDNDTNIDFYQNGHHEYIHFCSSEVLWYSWDGTLDMTKLQSNYTQKTEEICNGKELRPDSYYIGNSIFILLSIILYFFIWEGIPWIYKAEIYPFRLRAKGSAVGTMAHFVNYFIAISVIPFLLRWIGSLISLLFMFMCIASFVFAVKFVYKTKGIMLEDIESRITDKNR